MYDLGQKYLLVTSEKKKGLCFLLADAISLLIWNVCWKEKN